MYRRNHNSFFKHLDFYILDTICLVLSYVIANYIRHRTFSNLGEPLYRNVLLALVVICFAVAVFQDTFSDVLKRGYFIEFNMTLRHTVIVIFLGVMFLFVSKSAEDFSRIMFIFTGVIYFISSYIVRVFWKRMLMKHRVNAGSRTMLVITNSEIAEVSLNNMKHNNFQSFRIVGVAIVDKDMKGQVIANIPVVAKSEEIVRYVCKEWIDEIFIDMPDGSSLDDKIMEELNEIGVVIHVKLAKDSEVIGRKQFVEKIADYTVLTTSMNFATPMQMFVKRTLDVIGGIVGCIMCGIAVIIIGPIIKIQSPGPIFFSQTRVGQNGKLFKLHKFRSMYMDAEERKKELMDQNKIQDPKMFKIDNDPRITPIGRFIRKTSIDELPQFLDVLIGNMSLVGTRPPLPDEVKEYEPHHHARLAIRPGITGLWQVSGRSEITDFEEVVKLDTEYINNWDLGLDIKILFKTVLVVLLGKGSV